MGLTSTWGPRERPSDPSTHRELLGIVRAWLAGGISLSEIRRLEAWLPQRRSLALVVNNECNLRCAHCFLQIPALTGRRLTTDEWVRVIESAVREEIGQYLLVGKEVFLGRTGPELVAHLGELRRRHPWVRTGVITNGTLLHLHHDLLRRSPPSHMDISMEGAPDDNDAIRGPGATLAVRKGVQWAAELLGDALYVTLTIQRRNLRSLARALLAFADMGATRVGMSPYEPFPHTDPSLTLSMEDCSAFFRGLARLGALRLPRPMLVQVDALPMVPEMLVQFVRSEWFDLDLATSDSTGFLYINRTLENGLTLSFRFTLWPLAAGFHTRISADGHILCAADGCDARAYAANSLGNIRDHDLDYGAASRAANRHPRLRMIDDRFEHTMAHLIRNTALARRCPTTAHFGNRDRVAVVAGPRMALS